MANKGLQASLIIRTDGQGVSIPLNMAGEEQRQDIEESLVSLFRRCPVAIHISWSDDHYGDACPRCWANLKWTENGNRVICPDCGYWRR